MRDRAAGARRRWASPRLALGALVAAAWLTGVTACSPETVYSLPTPTPGGDFVVARNAMAFAYAGNDEISDSLVLKAMRTVRREEFVLPRDRERAYREMALAINAGQTISQPLIVALMTDLLDLKPGERVLEVGTGSGYQGAVLAEITDHVYSIEIIPSMAVEVAARLDGRGELYLDLGVGPRSDRGWQPCARIVALDQLAVGRAELGAEPDQTTSIRGLRGKRAGAEVRDAGGQLDLSALAADVSSAR